MNTNDMAEYLGLHPLTIQRYAREGRIPAFKIGSDWRFHRKYVEKWIKDKLPSRKLLKRENAPPGGEAFST